MYSVCLGLQEELGFNRVCLHNGRSSGPTERGAVSAQDGIEGVPPRHVPACLKTGDVNTKSLVDSAVATSGTSYPSSGVSHRTAKGMSVTSSDPLFALLSSSYSSNPSNRDSIETG